MAKKFDVAVMHDYFVDRLVHVDAIPQMMGSHRRKGVAQGAEGSMAPSRKRSGEGTR